MNRKRTSKAALVAVAVALVALLAFCLAACDDNPTKPVLGVTVHSQQAPYSPDGAKPFTDGTQADVTGLPEGYTLQIGLTAEFDGIPQAGESAPLVWDGTVKVMNGDVDVTAEFDVQVTIDEGATFTVVKADMDFGNLFVGTAYDGKAHSFNEFAEQLMLPDGAEQTEYTVKDGDETYTAGGEYPVEITFAETANYNEQTVIGRLCIRTFADAEGNLYSISEASAAAAKSADGLTVYMFEDTAVAMDTVVGDGLTVVLRTISDTDTEADSDISDTVGVPTYVFGGQVDQPHADTNPAYIEYTLSVEDGAELGIQGAVIVSGLLGNEGQKLSGHTSGKHSVLSVAGGVTVADGGVLDVRGYVRGEGSVTAESGSTVYQPFIVYDYRGGTNTVSVYQVGKVIPFNTYDLFYNLQTNVTFEYGATATSYLDLYTATPKQHNTSKADLIGVENAFILMSEGSVVKTEWNASDDFANASGKNKVTLTGNVSLGDLTVTVRWLIQEFSISLSSVRLAFSHRFDWQIGDGTTVTTLDMPYDYKLLPGARVTVSENATLTVEKSMTVYSEFEDTSFGSLVYPDMPAGELIVNGSLVFADGAAFGGRIISENDGATVTTGSGFTSSVNSIEGNCGSGLFSFYKVFDITETARFDEGIRTAEDIQGESDKYMIKYREYGSDAPVQAGRTYTYDAESGSWN